MNEILAELQSIFTTAFGATFKKYFIGKIEVPAQSQMPLLCVIPVGTLQKRSGTLRDDTRYTIAIEIITTLKKYLDATAGEGNKLDTLEALISFVENRDSDGVLEASTVMGILTDNLSIGGKVLYTDNMNAEYEQYYSAENWPMARVRVTFEAFKRPNRT